MFRKLTSGVALVTTLSLSLSGLVFSPAHADSPADGYYVCTTGQLRAEEDNSLAYTITNGVVTTGGSCAGTVVIPAGVTRIENGAFYGASALTSITIPESVTSIGTYAFGFASALNSVNIPGSVTSIGASAFYGASALTSITIPGSVTNVSSNMLLNASALTSVTISEGVTVIDGGAFWGASALTSITIPTSITRIESNAFNLTSALKDYYFSGNGPSTVREDSFAGVASGAKAHISATATGFGTDPTWYGLVIDRALPNYTVTYNVANGTAITSESVTQGSSIQTAPVSTRAGYTLSGWSTSANGSIVKFPYTVTSDITLYAIWTQTKTPTKTATANYAAQFSAGSSVITKSAESAIKKMVSKSGKSATFTVTGVATKVTGVPDSYVKGLAKARAEKVSAYLVKLGVKKSNISIKVKIVASGITPKTDIVAK